MPTPIDPKRLPRLRAALKGFGDADMLPQKEIAAIYGVTNARFTTLVHERFENFPAPERRGDKTHWYAARASIEAMIAYLQGTGAKKQAAAARAAAVMSGAASDPIPVKIAPAKAKRGQPPPEPEPELLMSPAEIDKLASAQTRMFRLDQEKRLFVRADLARGLIRTLFTTVQRGVAALPTEVDPNGELPPLHRARLEAAVRAAQSRIFDAVKSQIEDEDMEAVAA